MVSEVGWRIKVTKERGDGQEDKRGVASAAQSMIRFLIGGKARL